MQKCKFISIEDEKKTKKMKNGVPFNRYIHKEDYEQSNDINYLNRITVELWLNLFSESIKFTLITFSYLNFLNK